MSSFNIICSFINYILIISENKMIIIIKPDFIEEPGE